MIVVLAHAVSQIHRPVIEASDYALLEMGARSALHGVQRLGPYSRFRWDQPGPLTFYWSAPFYALSGQRPEGVGVAAVLSNLASVAAIVVVVRRAAGAAGGWAAAAIVLVVLNTGGASWLDNPWNPFTIIMPLAAAAVLAAAAFAGVRWAVPFLVVAATYAVQTHVGTAPVLALLIVTLGPLTMWRWRRARQSWRRPIVVGTLLLALMWAFPLLQQITGHPGNMSKATEFFMSHGGNSHSLAEAIKVTGPELTLIHSRSFGSLAQLPSRGALPHRTSVNLVLALLGVLAALLANLHRKRWFPAGLCVAALAGAVGSVVAAQRAVGPLYGYLTSSALAMGTVLWLAIAITVAAEAATVLSRGTNRIRLGSVALAVACILVASVIEAAPDASASLFAHKNTDRRVTVLLSRVRSAVRARTDRPVFIDPQAETETWSLAALVANQLEREGTEVRTPPFWEFMFGAQRTASDSRSTHIRFVDVRAGHLPILHGRVLGQIGFTRVYAVS